ncbi:MAG: Cytochrome c oxidase subunit 6B [Thelocarpon superellum]|nr:MAG: Cytochrome c oxidase subunit 6B [Thelocarpon superellum]
MSDSEERETKPFKFVTGFDARFPNQNQTKHCWQNYVDYHKCVLAKGEEFAPCRQVSAVLIPNTLRTQYLHLGHSS